MRPWLVMQPGDTLPQTVERGFCCGFGSDAADQERRCPALHFGFRTILLGRGRGPKHMVTVRRGVFGDRLNVYLDPFRARRKGFLDFLGLLELLSGTSTGM